MKRNQGTLRVGGRAVQLSNLDKILYPGDDISKWQVVDYYRRVAPHALPFARDRFLTLHRFPDGMGSEGFFQQAHADYFPGFVEGVSAPRVGGGELQHVVLSGAAGLVYLANQATLTFHGWLSRRDRPDHPDRLVIDLDPPDDDFKAVCEAALLCRSLLASIGLTGYVMTTGSRGLHVVCPLDRSGRFDTVRNVAMELAGTLAGREPDWLTTEQRKERRGDRIYLDVMRNAYGQTSVLPYSLRARPGAPVATPLHWKEVGSSRLEPRRYHLGNLFRRLGRIDDPWAGMARHAANIDVAARRLKSRQTDPAGGQ